MEFLGLHYSIWIVLVLYFAGMLLMGWWSKRGTGSQEGYLLGNRQFGWPMMVMHAFGAGTHPGNVVTVISEGVVSGASGIWASWMWLFGTPFYWIIAPVIRRMRCLTMADFFRERFGRAASILYIIVASIGMIIFLGGVLLATTRTVQGVMGKADTQDSEIWFFGILFVSTAVFIIYSYWGGIIAAIRTDMIQGLMIIALSFIAIPVAFGLKEVGGFSGTRTTLISSAQKVNQAIPKAIEQWKADNVQGALAGLRAIEKQDAGGTISEVFELSDKGDSEGALAKLEGATEVNYLSLFHSERFNVWAVLLLCINAPLTALAFPHLMSVCAAGRTEWEGRVGFTYGNVLKRICTIGWCVLGLCWLAYLINTGSAIHKDAAFGDSIRTLFSAPLQPLQGVMLACVMAAAMSSGDAVQVTVAGLFSQNIYRVYTNPNADEKQLVHVTRIIGVFIALLALVVAILKKNDLVGTILDYFNVLSIVGISTAMGILWKRMNTAGMFSSTILAGVGYILTRHVLGCGREITVGVPILVGVLAGVLGSLVTKPPKREVIEKFFTKIYIPIGQDKKLELPLDEAIPQSKRWLTAGGLFIVKPSRQSWVGFLVALGICLACVLFMLAILNL
ncbi:MAG: sodium:solute symporter family protein [Planctomycetota bacterium]|jgi:Na+/proline symporter